MVDRIRFIKRAQELGFSLEEIATLLQLEDGANRKAIRTIANDRLSKIRDKIADLKRMETVSGIAFGSFMPAAPGQCRSSSSAVVL
jgi:DNA-binding transcriptional MerR regulator